MTRISPPEVALRDVTPNDPRLGQLLGIDLGPDEVPHAILIGFPCDEGVRRNGGRVDLDAVSQSEAPG